jgi:hypothetical protein
MRRGLSALVLPPGCNTERCLPAEQTGDAERQSNKPGTPSKQTEDAEQADRGRRATEQQAEDAEQAGDRLKSRPAIGVTLFMIEHAAELRTLHSQRC